MGSTRAQSVDARTLGTTPGAPGRSTARTPTARTPTARTPTAWTLVGLGAACWAVVMVVGWPTDPWNMTPWMVMYATAIAVSVIVLLRRPGHPLALWFGLAAQLSAFELIIWVIRDGLADGMSPASLAWWNAAQGAVTVLTAVAVANILARFPVGAPPQRHERIVLALLWSAFLVPLALLVGSPTVIFPFYVEVPAPVPNPFGTARAIDPLVLGTAQETIGSLVVLVGAALLLVRYRRADISQRRAARWLLVPVALLPVPLATQAVIGDAPLISVLWGLVGPSFAAAIGMGLLQPAGFNADRAVRRSIIYGLLWVVIAIVHAAGAALVGAAAGTLLPVGWAVVITVLAAIGFQPQRTRLERLADRRVFGNRPDPARLVVGLGETLQHTLDLNTLLPRMGAALKEGMGLRWARIRLTPTDSSEPTAREPPALTVPVEMDGEVVGVIECGPPREGVLLPGEIAIIQTFARQAAMAVHNLRLRDELVTQADLLAQSRSRLVRAQDSERRRIERNIHDGIQQDITALIGLAGHARQEYQGSHRDDRVLGADLDAIKAGLERVLADVRELAQGIHPSVLTDRGLLVAVEALCARHPVAVTVRATDGVRALRPPEEVEGAAYFTVAEALANALKHASAHHIDVDLGLLDGWLDLRVHDDGVGFDPQSVAGNGLANLAARVAAVGGCLAVASRPGAGATVTAGFPVGGTA